MDDLRYFKIEEFDCACCGKNEMNIGTLHRLDNARHFAQVAFKINSGYRCTKHNESEGGKDNSAHLFGFAADIEANNSRNRFLILEGLIVAGFNRFGVGKTFIHADDDPSKDPEVLWPY